MKNYRNRWSVKGETIRKKRIRAKITSLSCCCLAKGGECELGRQTGGAFVCFECREDALDWNPCDWQSLLELINEACETHPNESRIQA
jgi:hypothetical protein